MFSQSLNTVELSAPLPRWALLVSLALFAATTAILETGSPAPPVGNDHAAVPAIRSYDGGV